MRRATLRALVRAKRLASAHPDVEAVDFGILYRAGKRRGRGHGIRFHVARKRQTADLSADAILPSEIDGVPCDVVIGVYEPHAPNRLGPLDPIMPGISIGNVPRQGTGTIGCFVRDVAGEGSCLLSNWHVLCGSTDAEAGDLISQPGPRHLGLDPARTIGRLLRWAELSHGLDAAVASLDTGLGIDPCPLGIPNPPSGVTAPVVGMRVMKSGAISGETQGVIDGIGGIYLMDYSPFGDGKRWMDGFRIIPVPASPEAEISLAGDSGSVWIDLATGAAVGLHFAGEDGAGPLAEYALAHPMRAVCDRLGIAI